MRPNVEEVARRLRWVTMPAHGIDLRTFPDFFLIGPPRTGSTWLHAQLERHPSVFVTQPKEVFYFSTLRDRDRANHVTTDLRWYLALFADDLPGARAKDAACRREYGEPFAPLVRGEATASYAGHMDRELIAEARTLNPHLRAIVIVRDPVERAWSHIQHALKDLGRRVDETPVEALLELAEHPFVVACGSYRAILARWREGLEPGHLFVGRFDDVRRRPTELVLDVHEFLGVRADRRFVAHDVARPRNAGPARDMPAGVRDVLERQLRGETEWLREAGLLPASDRPARRPGRTGSGSQSAADAS